MPLCFPEQSCQLLVASTPIVHLLHCTAFAMVTSVLQVAGFSGQFSALFPLNVGRVCHSWILSSLGASLSLGSGFRGHYTLWGFPSLLTLLFWCPLISLTFQQGTRAQFSICCLVELQIHIFRCYSNTDTSSVHICRPAHSLKICLVHPLAT